MWMSPVISTCPPFALTNHSTSVWFRRTPGFLLHIVTGFSTCSPKEARTFRRYFWRFCQRFAPSESPWTFSGPFLSISLMHSALWNLSSAHSRPFAGETLSFWEMSFAGTFWTLLLLGTLLFFLEHTLRQACWSGKTWAMPAYNLDIVGITPNPASPKMCGFLH